MSESGHFRQIGTLPPLTVCPLRPESGHTRFSRSVNWFTQRGGASVIGIGYARSCAPTLFAGSDAPGGDHPNSRTGSRDLGGVPHRMIFQESAERLNPIEREMKLNNNWGQK
jgi:hypothetical protein